ncbi:sugar phosphate nucleotidyltransferase [Amylibacter sp.]|nr:sugar phosphate nucleotidyltransferase [Amylibacter sp.]
MFKIYSVLLAGGSGTRLWPLSGKSYPKQNSNNNNRGANWFIYKRRQYNLV